MGKHSRTTRFHLRSALAVAMVGIGVAASVGTAQAEGPAPVEGTPCTEAAAACVDLAGGKAWLIEDGEVVRGPVPISSGAPGHETPRGDFRVQWKDANHRSAEFNNAPMPFAVFFAPGGIAFHEGNLHTKSAGCVRLNYKDAEAFYEYLHVGDRVQVR
jgi:Uncharacterized protein conserved in bacteria